MYSLHVTFCVLILCNSLANCTFLTDQCHKNENIQYEKNVSAVIKNVLPAIYYMDNYDLCKKENNLYCIVSIKLYPLNYCENSKSWKIIQVRVCNNN